MPLVAVLAAQPGPAGDGRGVRRRCCFEDCVSSELIVRLTAFPQMLDVLRALPSHASALSLENCPAILALAEQLLAQKHDRYVRIALDALWLPSVHGRTWL